MNKQLTMIIAYILLAAFFVTGLGGHTAYATPSISTNAYATALIDVQSGRLLYSHNGDVKTRIASLTKIMTAIVAIEQGDLSDKVEVLHALRVRKAHPFTYEQVREISLANLLYGLMLRSGNDAATAIAEHVGGSEAGFVYLMNLKAAELGLSNTQFRNPHGLDEDGHFSSANDLAVLTAYALKNKIFAEIVKTEFKQAPNPNEKWNYSWRNKNKMLQMYEGADGVKTGYTKKAFRCLVSSATRNDQQLVAVTLNDGDDWRDHRNLLDFGFKHYPQSKLASLEETVPGYSLVYGADYKYPLQKEELGKIQASVTLIDPGSAHYALGERGRMQFFMDGTPIGSVPLYDKGSYRLKLNDQRAEQSFNQFKRHSRYHHWYNKLQRWFSE